MRVRFGGMKKGRVAVSFGIRSDLRKNGEGLQALAILHCDEWI
jgi:hypothetical protein